MALLRDVASVTKEAQQHPATLLAQLSELAKVPMPDLKDLSAEELDELFGELNRNAVVFNVAQKKKLKKLLASTAHGADKKEELRRRRLLKIDDDEVFERLREQEDARDLDRERALAQVKNIYIYI